VASTTKGSWASSARSFRGAKGLVRFRARARVRVRARVRARARARVRARAR